MSAAGWCDGGGREARRCSCDTAPRQGPIHVEHAPRHRLRLGPRRARTRAAHSHAKRPRGAPRPRAQVSKHTDPVSTSRSDPHTLTDAADCVRRIDWRCGSDCRQPSRHMRCWPTLRAETCPRRAPPIAISSRALALSASTDNEGLASSEAQREALAGAGHKAALPRMRRRHARRCAWRPCSSAHPRAPWTRRTLLAHDAAHYHLAHANVGVHVSIGSR